MIVMVRGVQLPGDPRLHDLNEAVIEGREARLVTFCGIRAAEGDLWQWTEESKAPPPCIECRDLPPFWSD